MRFVVLFLGLASYLSASAQCYRLVWSDEFDGTTLDTTAWSYQIGDGCPSLCGWGNDEQEYYQRDNLEVSGGTLKIEARQESVGGRPYTSSRIRTYQKQQWTTGRIEARMKMPIGRGLWPAFWMLADDPFYGTWPMSGEIDIMEMIGHLPAKTFGTIHYGPAFPANQYTGNDYDLPSGTLNDDFHIYAIEWEENTIRWYLDDVLYGTLSEPDLAPYPWRFNRDFYLLLNCAVGGYFPGYPDATTIFPQLMEVDYVRVYQDVEKTIVSGPDLVLPGSESTRYYVQPVEGATYTWTAPSGSSIATGQGTRVATVDWGTTSGDLEVQIDAPTCSTSIARSVDVLQPNCEETVLDFDGVANVSWISTDGVYDDAASNPAPNAVNASVRVARYERNPSVAFNVLRYTSDGFNDAGLLKSGDLVLEMDVYSNAPAGAQISIQLENMARASLAYPSGRNSVYQAVTTKSNEWERLRFNFALAPDGTLSNNEINQLLILFQPGTSSNAFFWFDNLRVVDAACAATGIGNTTSVDAGKVWPQPFSEQLNWSGSEPAQQAELLDQLGRRILVLPVSGNQSSWSLGSLGNGYYWLRILTESGWITQRVVKIANP